MAVDRGKRKREDTIEMTDETCSIKLKFEDVEEGSGSSSRSTQCRGAVGPEPPLLP